MRYKKGFTSWKDSGLRSGNFVRRTFVSDEEEAKYEEFYGLKLMGNAQYKRTFLSKRHHAWWRADFIFTQDNK